MKSKSAISPLFHGLEVLSSVSDKAEVFCEIISDKSDLDDSVSPIPAFLLIANVKLYNIPMVLTIFKKVITGIVSSK